MHCVHVVASRLIRVFVLCCVVITLLREIHLPDGRRLLRHDRYDHVMRQQQLKSPRSKGNSAISVQEDSTVLRVHPAFRVVALGTPPDRDNLWLTAEVMGIFPIVESLPNLSVDEKLSIVASLSPPDSIQAKDLLEVVRDVTARLSAMSDDPVSVGAKLSASLNQSSLTPSCRQLLRLWLGTQEYLSSACTSVNSGAAAVRLDLRQRVRRMFMVQFMPHALRDSFDMTLDAALFPPEGTEGVDSLLQQTSGNAANRSGVTVDRQAGCVHIGNATLPLNKPSRPELVPDTLFVDVPAHVRYLEQISHDILAGDRHILLIGNQGGIVPIYTCLVYLYVRC